MAAIWEIAITQNIDSSENFRPTSSFQHQENISARKKNTTKLPGKSLELSGKLLQPPGKSLYTKPPGNIVTVF